MSDPVETTTTTIKEGPPVEASTTTTKAAPTTAMPEPPTLEETPGARSFFVRYWQFCLWGAISLMLVLNNQVFFFLGSLIYLPLQVFSVFILAFVIRHVLNRTSTDAYIKEDAYDTDFAGLTPFQKVLVTQIQFICYLLVIAWIASSVL